MNNDLEAEYRVGVTIRKQGETYAFSDSFKTEEYRDQRELDEEITNFIQGSLASLEEEIRDEDE